MMRTREVRAGGEILYNVAGKEDLLPPATRIFKADRSPSERYRLWNEQKHLSGFDRYIPGKLSNPGLMESEDMYHAMCGNFHGRRRLEIDRIGRSLEDEETGYGPNWVAIEIEKGGNGQQRAKSLEPQRSQTPGTEGSQTARQPRGAADGPPLRWPSHQWLSQGGNQQAADAGSQTSRSGAPLQIFRTPTSVADWGGLNGLGIWRSASAHAIKSPSSRRARTPSQERPYEAGSQTDRPKSPSAPGSTTGYGFRSPPPAPGLMSYGSSPALPVQDRNGGVDSASVDNYATQPRAALDTTREKGAEFPRTPQGGSTAKGVWSRPSDTMRLASPAVEVFSL